MDNLGAILELVDEIRVGSDLHVTMHYMGDEGFLSVSIVSDDGIIYSGGYDFDNNEYGQSIDTIITHLCRIAYECGAKNEH